MTNRQLSTWFIRILVYLLNYIEMIMDKALHCLLILTNRPMCNIHSYMYSTMSCDKSCRKLCVYEDWHEQIKKRKCQKILVGEIHTGGLHVCLPNYQFCVSRCPSKYLYTYLPIKLSGDLHMDRSFREIEYLLNSLFFTFSNLHYRLNYVVWIILKYRGGAFIEHVP